jgi:signal transduction histidine kinase
MSQLFLPLDRLSQLKPAGGGLGLAVVRQIVERLGGEVGVENEGIAGQGCTFSFILPAYNEMTEA